MFNKVITGVLIVAAFFTMSVSASASSGAKNENNKQHVSAVAALKSKERPKYEQRYLNRYDKFAKEFGASAPGRNLVLYGDENKNGEVYQVSEKRIKESTAYMRSQLHPPEVVYESTDSSYSGAVSGAPTSVVECESGGDYGAVNPAGYYGAYQFDQSTWDAYAPEGWAGVNPATAPPEVQDQAAANVDYDAWPNC